MTGIARKKVGHISVASLAVSGRVKMTSFSLSDTDAHIHTIGLDPLGDMTVLLPDVNNFPIGEDENIYWEVILISDTTYNVELRVEDISQSFSTHLGYMNLRRKGQGVKIKLNRMGETYWYEDISAIGDFQPISIISVKGQAVGDDYQMVGNILSLGNNQEAYVYFEYRLEGSGDTWTKTANQNFSAPSIYYDTITGGNLSVYEYRAVAENIQGEKTVGEILSTSSNYYSGRTVAMGSNLIHYWNFEDTVNDDEVCLISDTLMQVVNSGGTISNISETMGAVSKNKKNLSGSIYFQNVVNPSPDPLHDATYNNIPFQYIPGQSYTFLLHVDHRMTSGDHTIMSNGSNRLSLAQDNANMQLEVEGSMQSGAGGTVDGKEYILFVVVDALNGETSYFRVDDTLAQELISFTTTPVSYGQLLKLADGTSGDSNHQNGEYMQDGAFYNVAIWEYVKSPAEMIDIAEVLLNGYFLF